MSTEIIPTDLLCWILDNEGKKHYKKCELKELQYARTKKTDISVEGEIVLTDYQISKYGKADIIDRFIFFSLPKYSEDIKRRFKNAMDNMPDYRKNTLTYEQISETLKKWANEEEYYS